MNEKLLKYLIAGILVVIGTIIGFYFGRFYEQQRFTKFRNQQRSRVTSQQFRGQVMPPIEQHP
jgi:membrane protein DedA with SNARE-associated domain